MRPHFSKKKLTLANRIDRVIALNVFLRLTRDAENCLAALEMSHAVEESFLQLTGVSCSTSDADDGHETSQEHHDGAKSSSGTRLMASEAAKSTSKTAQRVHGMN